LAEQLKQPLGLLVTVTTARWLDPDLATQRDGSYLLPASRADP
jgi:hypothetical protein